MTKATKPSVTIGRKKKVASCEPRALRIPGGELLGVAGSQRMTVDAVADTDSKCTQKRKH